MTTKIEHQIVVQGIAADLERVTGVPVPVYEMGREVRLSDLAFLRDGIDPKTVRLSRAVIIANIPCVAIGADQQDGTWDVMLMTCDYGFQLYPGNPEKACNVKFEPNMDELLFHTLVEVTRRVTDFDRIQKWFAGCCEMNGLDVPDYIESTERLRNNG